MSRFKFFLFPPSNDVLSSRAYEWSIRSINRESRVIIIITRKAYRQTYSISKAIQKGWSVSTTGYTTIELLIFYIDCCRVINISI